MDYSLLLAVEENFKENFTMFDRNILQSRKKDSFAINGSMITMTERSSMIPFQFEQTRHTFLSENCKYLYHISVIDYL